MSNFIKDAITELEHVVWPTPNETRKYMTYTVGVIVVLGTFLAVLGYMLRVGLLFTRDQFPHDVIAPPTVSGEGHVTQDDLQSRLEKIKKNRTNSGTHTSSSGSLPIFTTATGT